MTLPKKENKINDMTKSNQVPQKKKKKKKKPNQHSLGF